MSKAEPTAGEWSLCEGFVEATKNNVTTRIGLAMRTGYFFSGVCVPSDEADANARLFAASKDLLAAVESLLDLSARRGEICPDPEGEAIRDAARAAIAKAKGEM